MSVFHDNKRARLEIGYAQQALLTAAGILSRCLGWHRQVGNQAMRDAIRTDLGVDQNSFLYDRRVRDAFEHIDERMESVVNSGTQVIVDSNIV
jgi:hypothetical protein